jgi:hypothetical protein
VLIQLFPPNDKRLSLETCRGGKINTLKEVKKSASSWLKIHKQNYLFLARVMKSRNYVSDFALYCCITLTLQLEGIKADKHFQVEVPVPGKSALLLYKKQQTQRRGLPALSQAGRMRAALPVTQARPGACQCGVAYIQIYGKRGINC